MQWRELPVWRASTGQSRGGRAWLALGALPDATHVRLRSRLGNPQGVAWRGPERWRRGEVWPHAPRVATARVPQ